MLLIVGVTNFLLSKLGKRCNVGYLKIWMHLRTEELQVSYKLFDLVQ